jgi:hypothetical protein
VYSAGAIRISSQRTKTAIAISIYYRPLAYARQFYPKDDRALLYCYNGYMDEHMPPQDPNDPDNTDDDQTDVWEETGSHEPARPLTPDEARALGSQGLGGEHLVAREASRQDDINHGVGTNEPPLGEDARTAAAAASLQTQQELLNNRRVAAEALPEGSERSDALARIRLAQDNLDQKNNQA